MIVRASTAGARMAHIGQSGGAVAVAPEDSGVYFYEMPRTETPSLSALPLAPRRCARIALLASARCVEGLAWHAACMPLAPGNWRRILDAAPDYLLVESCVHDSCGAWPQLPHAAGGKALVRDMAEYAARKGIPSLFWHTLGPEILPCFMETLSAFAIVACADERSREMLRQRGFAPRLLPQAFAPERFTPVSGPRFEPPSSRIVFDGIARLARFSETRDAVAPFMDKDLVIVDSGMFTPPYNFARSAAAPFTPHVLGTFSGTEIQELYKESGAYLSVTTTQEGFAPAWEQRALEAAACRLPVLHVGPVAGPVAEVAHSFSSAEDAAEYWQELRSRPLARERAAHLAWRASHEEHTFARRMATIHQWFGIGKNPFPMPRASIITPSMRPDRFAQVMAQYEAQTWPNKELVYVFNGRKDQMPEPDRPDVRAVHVPPEHAAGMAMNAGIMEAQGDCVFRLDDDDLYGARYVADRMLHFRELAIDSLSNARAWMSFDDRAARVTALDAVPQDDTVLALGSATYRLLGYTGASWAARREFALRLGFLEAANAHADVAFLSRAMSLAPASAHLRVAPFNLCVRRGAPTAHTWGAARAELDALLAPGEVPLTEVFV